MKITRKHILNCVGTFAVLFGSTCACAGCSDIDKKTEVLYTAAFDTDGGAPVPADQIIAAGGKITAPSPNPEKQGYEFLFWHLNGIDAAYDFNTEVTDNITLIAKWMEKSQAQYWQVVWDLKGGIWPDDQNQASEVIQGGTLAEPNAPGKEGFSFQGWYKEEGFVNRVRFPYDVSEVTSDFTLYAYWGKVATLKKYYVDNEGGNDNNDGLSPETAWKSLYKVETSVPKFGPGDSVLFKRGCTWTGHLNIPNAAGTESDRLTFGAYGSGDKPKLIGNTSNMHTVTLLNPKNVTFENFDVSHPSATMPPQTAINGVYVVIRSAGVYPNVVIKNNYIHDIEGHPVRDRHRQGGVFVRPEHTEGFFKDIIIEDNKFERCSTRAILFGSAGSEDKENRTEDYYNTNVIIRRNDISYTALEGIVIARNSKTVLIEYNKIFHAGAYCLDEMDIVLAGLWGNAKDMIIQYNEVAYTRLTNPKDRISMDSEAFDIDADSPGYQIIQYNYSHNNEGGFFLSMGDPGPDFEYGIIRYNISQNDGHPEFDYRVFELHGHLNGRTIPIYVYNNVFYNDVKVAVQKRSPGSILPGIEFRNNIFYAPALQFDDPAHIVYDNNLYYQGTKASNDTRAIVDNPQFISVGTGGDGMSTVDGYKLQAGSPAIGAGLTMPDNGGMDYWGNVLPASGKPAVGAYQPK